LSRNFYFQKRIVWSYSICSQFIGGKMKFLLTSLILLGFLQAQPAGYFQQQVDYTIDVKLNAAEKTYSGTERLIYTNHSPETLDFIWLHLYPNAYKDNTTPFARQQEKFRDRGYHYAPDADRGFLNVTSVKSGEADLKTELKPDAIDEMKVFLAKPLSPGETVILDMTFDGKFPKVFSRMGVFKKHFFSATQWYPKAVVYDRDGWHPDSYLDLGEFYGEFGNFDVSITLPKAYALDATGLLQDNAEEQAFIDSLVAVADSILAVKEEKPRKKLQKEWTKKRNESVNYEELKTVRFRAENVHDFAWFAGPYLMLRSTHNHNILTQVLVMPENVYGWRDVPKYADRTIWFYGKEVGKYQYPKASVVDGALEAGGGMEYPMITIISVPALEFVRILESVVMHEIGHNWFYGMLGSNERASTFLDEGMNSFVEQRYMQHFYGFNNMTDFKKLSGGVSLLDDLGSFHMSELAYGLMVNQSIDQPLNLRAEDFTRDSYGGVNYQKGAALLFALEYELGDSIFSRGMHTYFDRWSGKHPRLTDFFAIMSEVSGHDLTGFIESWYNSTTYNDFSVSKLVEQKSDGAYLTEVFLKNKGTMKNSPAPLRLITEAGDSLTGRWNGQEDQPVRFNHNSPQVKIEVNPERRLFETNYLNNQPGLPEIDFNLIPQIPRFDTYPVNILPYAWYNGAVDKLRLGLLYWSGNPINNQWFTRGLLYYGLESENIGYSLAVGNRFRSPYANYLDASVSIRDKSGLKRISAEFGNHFERRDDTGYVYDFGLDLDYTDMHDLRYMRPGVFADTVYTTVTLRFNNNLRRMLWSLRTRAEYEKSLPLGDGQAEYQKISFSANFARRLTQNSYFRLSTFAGSYSGDLIPQELFYAMGDIDPKQKSFAPGRESDYSVFGYWKFDQGLKMYGYSDVTNPFFANRNGASATLDIKVKYLPELYISAAVLSDKLADLSAAPVFAETGLKLEAAPFSFVFPVYISNPVPGEDRLDFRMKFNLKLAF